MKICVPIKNDYFSDWLQNSGAKPRKGPFLQQTPNCCHASTISIIHLNCLRWSPKCSGRKKEDRGTLGLSIARCGQQLLAFHHLASTSSFSHHASLLLLGLTYRWSGKSHIENLFCSQEQWDAGCDLKFGNLKRELVVRKLSDVRVAKNPRLRSWRYSERLWCKGVIRDFQVFTSSATIFDSCVYGPDFSGDFICVVVEDLINIWTNSSGSDALYSRIWRYFKKKRDSEFRETNIEE